MPKQKLRVSDYARLCGITTNGVYKQSKRKRNPITIEVLHGMKLVVLSTKEYKSKCNNYLEDNGSEFKLK